MRRVTDVESRRNDILNATIEAFIEKGQPVSSESLSQYFDLSSATIRNVMAELEYEGYLVHPHTSAGRIPTERGYRYYINYLMQRHELAKREREEIQAQYCQLRDELEAILERTSGVISQLTHYTGIVSFLDWQDKIYYRGMSNIAEQQEFKNDIQRIKFLLAALEEKEKLLNLINRDLSEDIKVYIGEESGCNEIKDCSLVVSTYKVRNKPTGRLAVLGPTRMPYSRTISTLDYISNMVGELLAHL